MKSSIFAQMRAATHHLINKGPSSAGAAIQQALAGLGLAGAKMPAPPATPPMRDINPPPQNRAEAAPQANHQAFSAREAAAAPSAAEPLTPEPHDATPNPATHPGEYAQNLLKRMGIKLDLQANTQGRMPAGFEMPQFDLSNMELPGFKAPAVPPLHVPEGARFIGGSYRNHAGSRNYKLYIPSSFHGQAMPLLVMLHGCTQNPDDFAAGTQMNAVAEERQCFVVYPEQNQAANSSKCWNWFNAIDQQRGQGEPSLIAGIAQQIIDEYPVIESEVYVAGLSAGGAMAVIVGTLYSDLFAAVGVHSGLPFASAQDLPSALSAMKRGAAKAHNAGPGTLPVIVFHGDRDTTVHPLNGDAVMAQGLRPHAAGAAASVASGSVPNGHRYTQTIHSKADGTPLGEHWVVHGAGHAWSGGSANGSYTDGKGPDASREMMRFFKTVVSRPPQA